MSRPSSRGSRSGSRPPRGPSTALAVDKRLVAPGSRFEILDGEVLERSPSDELHGTRHAAIAALLEIHAAQGYDVALNLLTRTSKHSDMAPDASVFPAARDPQTGGRRIEELAFEVLSTRRLGEVARKARALSERGVRRVFAIDVQRRRALVWSAVTNAWELLPAGAVIADPALAVPLPIAALVGAMPTDDAIARALLARRHPVIEDALRAAEARGEKRGEARGQKHGRLDGKIQALLLVLSARGIKVGKKADRLIREATERQLDAWLKRAPTCRTVDELLQN